MDDTAEQIIERQTALANFDHARDDFEDAFSQVPNEALDYLPEGDDYSIIGVVNHITNGLRTYSAVLALMREMEFQEVRVAAAPSDDAQEAPHSGPNDEPDLSVPDVGDRVGRSRRSIQDALDEAHDKLASQLAELTHEDFSRSSQVFYPGAEEAFPTSASDITGWLTTHYREHAKQVLEMLGDYVKCDE